MNRRRLLIIILVAFFSVSSILCGKVIAYMFQQTQYEENLFTIAEVSCEVKEEFDGVNKTSIQIQNTGNIDAYLRVRLVSYWGDANGNIGAKPSSMPEVKMAVDYWVPGSNNTYYYRMPVEPGNFTQELLAAPIILAKDGDYLQVVEVFAEAIQSAPSGAVTSAVTSAWSVTLDADGYIATAP